MGYYFTSESVSAGHPDKVADQISDGVLDNLLVQDQESKVACETLVTTGLTVVAGEIKSQGFVNVDDVARTIIDRIGYNKAEYKYDAGSCGIISALHAQSADINRGVERAEESEQGAGDQGMMFGYACRDTEDYMPLPIYLAHQILLELDAIRREGKVMTYLRPDAKSQVTIEYNNDNTPNKVDTIVVSTQHDDFVQPSAGKSQEQADEEMLAQIRSDVDQILIKRLVAKLPAPQQKLFAQGFKLFVNPTGKFVIGGPNGDTGLTGRKIIVDTYGGKGAHGGGAFSGKDASKVDRSAAYATRHIAKNLVAAGVADEVLVQVAYAIGVAEPVGLYVNTYGTSKVNYTDGEIAEKVKGIFDMRPSAIIKRFGLKNPIFGPTAAYGHVGRKPYTQTVQFKVNGQIVEKTLEFFTWEKLDYVDKIKAAFQGI